MGKGSLPKLLEARLSKKPIMLIPDKLRSPHFVASAVWQIGKLVCDSLNIHYNTYKPTLAGSPKWASKPKASTLFRYRASNLMPYGERIHGL
jgi:hypothetical protein